MKRFFALGLAAAGLLIAPLAAFAYNGPGGAYGAPGPSVLSVPHHGPSVLAVPHHGRPSVLAVPEPEFRHHHRGDRHFRGHPGYFAPHRQPVWVQPQWMWNGWQWVWVPGYWGW